jgi:leucyl aminopeptidase
MPAPSDEVRRASADVGVDLDVLLDAEAAKADAGSVVVVPLARRQPPARLLVVGVGEGGPADWRSAGAALARRCGSVRSLAVVGVDDAGGLRSFAEGLALAAYRPPKDFGVGTGRVVDSAGDAASQASREAMAWELGTPGGGSGERSQGDERLGEVTFFTDSFTNSEMIAALRVADVVARVVYLARDLVNTPAVVASPAWLAARAVEVAEDAGLGVRVLDETDLVEAGFGGIVAVGRGSAHPPRLVQLSYASSAEASGSGGAHRVLIGKGITFDSGGLSLKPATSMVAMKTDMSGAAAVLATMAALPSLGVPGRVTGLLCLAENMISGSAMRPGDVVTCWGGTTVEVMNTDAEGRLVLADCLAYAVATLAPDTLVDLATLTGAVSVALGRRTAGLFASDDALAEALTEAGAAGGEHMWRLPLVEEYRSAIDSPVADLANVGRSLDVSAGTIVAALFLREFTAGLPWAHLDIAGTARSDGDDAEISRGGTGWGVRTLLGWLCPTHRLPADRAGSVVVRRVRRSRIQAPSIPRVPACSWSVRSGGAASVGRGSS